MRNGRAERGRGAAVRRWAAPLLAALLAAAASPAAATPLENYLSQYVLMMDWVNRATVYVPRHASDTQLADVAHAIAEQLVEKSQRLTPPEEFRDLHPHFLLVLENAERAFHYQAQGDSERADRHLAVVRDETRIMRQIQREIRIEIPELAL